MIKAKRLLNYRHFLAFLTGGVIGQSVRLDVSSKCQLKCPVCSTATGLNKNNAIGWGHLKFANFKKLLDENPRLKHIELSNWGEIFLNPDLSDMLRYAHEKKVSLSAANGVNLNTVSDEVAECLVKYQFRLLNVSIDGATNETYKMYRVSGDLNKVLANVQKINAFKQKYISKYPKLVWKFIVFGHNEHELPLARETANRYGMEFMVKFNHTPDYSPVKDSDFVRSESGLGVSSREEYKIKYRRDYKIPCAQLWGSPQINWDGKLMGCCANKYGDFGNVFEEGLETLLNSEKVAYTKRMLMGFEKMRDDLPCRQCPTYKRIQSTPSWRKPLKIFERVSISQNGSG